MSAKTMTAAAVATALCLAALPTTPSYADGGQDKTIIITFDRAQSNPQSAARDAVENAGGDVTKTRPITAKTVAVTVTATSAEAARIEDAAADQAGIAAAEPSRPVHKTATNDTYYSRLWNINNGAQSTYGVDAEDAWPVTTGSGAVVGVIDTGITAHPDLNGNVIAGYDFISSPSMAGDGDGWDSDPTDVGDYTSTDNSSWHGTHVAGIIAAAKDNGTGVVGVAPSASIEPLRVLGRGGGTESDIIAAIRWGAGLPVSGVPSNPHPADVLNLSLGGDGACGTSLQAAIDAAVAAGTAIVVAAGNDSQALGTTFPADCDNVIRVVATGLSGTLASYSNYGDSGAPATVSAPGGARASSSDWIVSTWNSGTTTTGSPSYVGMIGTSMAAPHVAGEIAMLRSAEPSLTVSQLTSLVTHNVTGSPDGCSPTRCGAGIINVHKAVAALPAPMVSTAAVSGAAKVGNTVSATASTSVAASQLTFQWQRSGAAIAGASGATYAVGVADLGSALSVRVTATVGARSASATSASVTVTPGTFTKLGAPSVSGTFKVGKKLKASSGRWTPAPAAYAYRWYRGNSAIAGATSTSYKLKKTDRRKNISVRVSVSANGFVSTWAASSGRKVK